MDYKLNLVLFGLAGCGKGTQAKLLSEKYGLVHISTGDIYRKHMAAKTTMGNLAASYIDGGHLVPDDLTQMILMNEIYENADAKGFIFDGFPRTLPQAEFLDKLLSRMNQGSVHAVVSIEVPSDILLARLLERGKTSKRVDDSSVELIEERFRVYEELTAPVKDYYFQKGNLWSINGAKPVEDVFVLIEKVIFDAFKDIALSVILGKPVQLKKN